jgi:magnesium chelatase accessory protein
MRWPENAQGWPLAEHSRFVLSRPHRWHVQVAGTGPTLLLIHGAGGATQSWRGLFPLLAADHHVIAVDLPGQGFTQMGARMRCGLDYVAEDLLALMTSQNWKPDVLIGHSAGAAIALRMAEQMDAPPVIGLNAALDRFEGMAGWLFPLMAKALSLTPFTADIFTRTASSPGTVKRLLASTGSTLDAEGIALYRRLVTDRTHVDATLAMMSQWTVDSLVSRLASHQSRTLLVAGASDGAVPPEVSRRVASIMPRASFVKLDTLGHLMHEENPEYLAKLIRDFVADSA